MDLTKVYNDLKFIQSHLHVNSEEGVRRWSNSVCDDYQIPLISIIGFLMDATYPINQLGIPIRDPLKQINKAIIDIVNNSSLNEILIYKEVDKNVRYRESVPSIVKDEIANWIASGTRGIAN